jgi:hypothetical protein
MKDGRGRQAERGRNTNLPLHTTMYFRAEHLPALICRAAATDNFSVNSVSTAEFRGRRAIHIVLTAPAPSGSRLRPDVLTLIAQFDLYLDAETSILLRYSRYAFDPNALENRSLQETDYSDYRRVNGVLMPYHIEMFLDGDRVSEFIVSTVSDQVVISDSDFSLENAQ